MLSPKPEIMTFHCYTGEMNEARESHPINNSLLTAGGSICGKIPQSPDSRLTMGENRKVMLQLLRILQHFPEGQKR